MAALNQIIIDWTTASGAGKASVMYFDNSILISTQRTALTTWLQAIDNPLDDSITWSLRNAGVIIDDATGTLVGSWSSGSVVTGTAGGTSEPVSDPAQVLIRWKTSSIVNGRYLQGRTYIPGLSVGNVDEGNVSAAAVTAFQTPSSALVSSGAGLRVFHRPISGSGGSSADVTSANVWTEFAVLRRRRG